MPAAGYPLPARDVPSGPPREVGLTDREGRIVLAPGFANGLVVLRLLAGGVEPLTEFPFMPGEQEGERTIILADGKPMTVALETKLNALRDEVIDQVALRGRIEARLKAKADANLWQDVKDQLQQYRALPARASFDERLKAATTEAEEQQNKTRTAVLTVHAQQQIAELQGLMDRYLDDAVFTAYEDALKQATDDSSAKTKKAQGKARSQDGGQSRGSPSRGRAGGIVSAAPGTRAAAGTRHSRRGPAARPAISLGQHLGRTQAAQPISNKAGAGSQSVLSRGLPPLKARRLQPFLTATARRGAARRRPRPAKELDELGAAFEKSLQRRRR